MCPFIHWIGENILSIATVALAIVTYLMVVEMKKAREEESRAYITADIAYDDIRGFIDIKNIGKRTAKNVIAKFTPDITPYLANHYKNHNPYEALKTMPPGCHKRVEIKNKIEAWSKPSGVPMPVNFVVDVEYVSDGRKCVEQFPVDLTYDKSISNPGSNYPGSQNV